MRELLEFCREQGLLARDEAEQLLAQHERQYDHPIRLLIASGMDESRLYRTFSAAASVPLVELESAPEPPGGGWPVSRETLAAFDVIPVSLTGGGLTVATWRWDRLEIIAPALQNIGGAAVSVVLVTPSCFDRLRAG